MTTVITEETDVASTHIHCPVCKGANVPGLIVRRVETLKEALVITLSTHTTWWVVCSACKAKVYSKVGPEELEHWTADELDGSVSDGFHVERVRRANEVPGPPIFLGKGVEMPLACQSPRASCSTWSAWPTIRRSQSPRNRPVSKTPTTR